MFDAMETQLGAEAAEKGFAAAEQEVAVVEPAQVAKPAMTAEDKSLGALEKARKIQEKLAQQKRAEEEAKQAQKAAEEYARQERLRKREESKKAGAEAKSSVIEETAASGVDVKSRSSTSTNSGKSRASEILERAKALTAKSKGLAEEQAAANAASNGALPTVGSAIPPSGTKKALPQQPERESKRSSAILEQARAARAIALGGAVAGRGRGLPTPPAKPGAAAAASVAGTPPAAGAGGGAPVARPPATKSAVSPSVNAALEKARKARNRLSVAKSLPAAGRGEGGIKVADKSLPSPRADGSVAAEGEATVDAAPPVVAAKAAARLPPSTGSPVGSPLPTSAKPRPPPPRTEQPAALEELAAAAATGEVSPAAEADGVSCPSCSATQVRGYTFCDECGAQAPAKVDTPEQRHRKATVRAMLAQKAAAKLAAGGESPQRSPTPGKKKDMPVPPESEPAKQNPEAQPEEQTE